MSITVIVIFVFKFFKSFLRLHNEIGGRWLDYVRRRLEIRASRRGNRTARSRLDLYDVFDVHDPAKVGLIPMPQAIEYAKPKKNRAEELFVYGTNTGEQASVMIRILRRPLSSTESGGAVGRDEVHVSLRIDDGNSNIYTLDESDVVNFDRNEYRACGLAYDGYDGIQTGRIKFRGYLRRNEESQLVFVQFRFLCLFFSKPFDHRRQFDAHFLAKELAKNSCGGGGSPICLPIEQLLEDQIEQFAQIKGIFRIECQEQKEMFFLGTIGRRFDSISAISSGKSNKKIFKICGFTEDGDGFQFGTIRCDNGTRFRYGFTSKHGERFKLLSDMSISSDTLERLPTLTSMIDSYEFKVKLCGGAKYVTGEEHKLVIMNDPTKFCQRVTFDGVEGMCFITEHAYESSQSTMMIEPKESERKEEASLIGQDAETLVVPLESDLASIVELTGGKGASLAVLKRLSANKHWIVPNAVIVTTAAHSVQTDSMKQFEEKRCNLERAVIDQCDVQKTCDDMVQWFGAQELNDSIRKAVFTEMERQFGPDWWEMKFAVRSSSSSEDSAEMSAAGQMSSFLGVKGEAAIVRAILHCWASQWAMVPVEYARAYGQALFSPMAVVVQRMVECEASGVVFTANPVDGDQRLLTVTANFGLGESVVSAASDPDTFQLAVRILSNSYQNGSRSIEGIASRVLGKKTLVTRLTEQDTSHDPSLGIQNETMSEDYAHKQCISDSDLLQLGPICLEIEQHYGNPRDIEWGLVGNRFYLLQSRPITNLDSNFSAYELMHEFDTPHMSEHEIYSRAHTGENFPGSSSWQSQFIFLNGVNFAKNEIKYGGMLAEDFNPLCNNPFGIVSNQLFLNMSSGPFLPLFQDYPHSDLAVAGVFAFFGHHIDDPDVLHAFRTASRDKQSSWRFKIAMPLVMLYYFFFTHRQIPACERKIFAQDYGEMARELRHVPLRDKLTHIFRNVASKIALLQIHGSASISSLLKSFALIKLLKSGIIADNPDAIAAAESDYQRCIAHCNDVVSAEVPARLREIAKSIQDGASFSALTDEQALRVLRGADEHLDEPIASKLFHKFLQRHGHRGYRELDPYYPTWREDPLPCVQVIRSLVASNQNGGVKQAASSSTASRPTIDQIISEFRTKLPWYKQAIIRHWLLPAVRDAIGDREKTKSMMVKFNDRIREAFWTLARDMVKQGILPQADLFFFLKLSEINTLTRNHNLHHHHGPHHRLGGDDHDRDTRSSTALLLRKARQRHRLYPMMDRLRFDEFVKRFRMRPRSELNTDRKIIPNISADDQNDQQMVRLTGTAVTDFGEVVRARVCVAERIEDARNIERGDILITYSTDIGWSPYFALLAGIVTEIGGTISHGAVIAREFGLPCLIAVDRACEHFRTGDIVLLDCAAGSITKVVVAE